MSEPETESVPEPYVDACAQIARCHRRQYPADYGVPHVVGAGPSVAELLAIAEMIVDRGPGA